jgi:ADP-ribosylglycohydrolase
MGKQEFKEINAWEYLNKLNTEALPIRKKRKIDNEMVRVVDRLIKHSDDFLLMMWRATPESGAPSCLVAGAIGAARNRGIDVSSANVLFQQGLKALQKKDYIKLSKITARIFKSLKEAPEISSNKYLSYEHPTLWNDFEKEIPDNVYPYDVKNLDFEDKVYASWLGEIIGGAFGGGPFEGYTHKAIKKVFGYVTNYIAPPSTVNDDMTYELAFLEAFKQKGYQVTSEDIAENWLMYIPWGWTAETIAFENLRRGIYPPESGSFLNFFSEWIGAQMRGGIIGLVSPGKPKLASRLAFTDGQVSHEKNGIYGECYVAAMVSLAFVVKDIRKIVVDALKYVPRVSEFYAVVSEVIDICKKTKSWNYVVDRTYKRFKDYHWAHTYPNIWIVVNSLLQSKGNFDKALRMCLMGGFDTDCNCGVVGAILGVLNGTDGIDKKWYEPFKNTLETYNMRGKFERMKITDLAKETVMAVREYW